MPGAIADLLSDFSSPMPAEGTGMGIFRRVRQPIVPETSPAENAVDEQAELIRSIEDRVRAEERERARQQLDQALSDAQEQYREELAVQRKAWVEEEALKLSSQIAAAFEGLEAMLSEKVARILTSVVPEALRLSAIHQFNEALGVVLSGENTALLQITGPEDMLNAVKAGMSMQDGIIEFIPSDKAELTLVAGDTNVQTQLNTWSERLQALLKAGTPC